MKLIQNFCQRYSLTIILVIFSNSALSAETTKITQEEVPTYSSFAKKSSEKEKPQETQETYNLLGIALFSGREPVSKAIRTITRSHYSHVGALLTKAEADPQDENNWCCFEATGSANEILQKHMFPQVRLTSWTELVEDYDGGIWVRYFQFDDDEGPSPVAVTNFVERFNGMPYEKDLSELLKAPLRQNRKSSLNSVFCSELMAEMLMELELIEAANSNNFIPKQFSTEDSVKLIGAKLSREIVIKNKRKKFPLLCCF